MNLPSIKEISDSFLSTIVRFPIAFVFLISVVILSIIANHGFESGYDVILIPVIFTLSISFFFSVAVDTFVESKKLSAFKVWILRLIPVIFAVPLYFFFFDDFELWREVEVIRFAVMGIIVFLSILIAPFLSDYDEKSEKSFWQYVINLFVKMFFAFVYFGLLFLGLMALLASVDYLFGFYIDVLYYADLWFLITGFLALPYVLSGLPHDFDGLHKMDFFPVSFKILIKYLLVPLVILYLFVLYIYSFSVLLTTAWPKGGVAGWIIFYSFVAVVVYFFLSFMKDIKLKYIDLFKKFLFPLLIPLVFILFWSLGMRIEDYGFTEIRFFGIVYGFWLILVSLYFIFVKKSDLRVLPLSLILFLLISAWGPLSAFSISKNSQLDRLQNVLTENGKVVDGKIQKGGKLTAEESEIARGALNYLIFEHGMTPLREVFAEEELKQYLQLDQWVAYDQMINDLGIDPNVYDTNYFTVYSEGGCAKGGCLTKVEGYKYLIDRVYIDSYNAEQIFEYGDEELSIELLPKNGRFIFMKGDEEILVLDLNEIFVSLKSEYNLEEIPKSEMTFEFNKAGLEGKVEFLDLSADKVDERWVVNYGSLQVMFND